LCIQVRKTTLVIVICIAYARVSDRQISEIHTFSIELFCSRLPGIELLTIRMQISGNLFTKTNSHYLMTRLLIKCKNKNCINRLNVGLDNTDSKPILFCSELCLNAFENQKFNSSINYEDPNEVRTLVQNLVSQTKQLQSELENLKKIRKTYFGLFKELDLKDETYKREWSFDKEVDE